MTSTTSLDRRSTCLACGCRIEPCLVRTGSPRCHDCRDLHAPLRVDLAEGDANVVPLVPLERGDDLRRAA